MPVTNVSDPNEDFLEYDIPFVQVSPDPVQYKPYNPVFRMENVFVRVKIPTRLGRLEGKGAKKKLILTPEGMAFLNEMLSRPQALIKSNPSMITKGA